MINLLIRMLTGTMIGIIAAPTSEPTTAPSEKLPPEFSILQTFDPFSGKPAEGQIVVAGPETGIVLTGIAQSNSVWTAFVMEAASKQVKLINIDDPIGLGKAALIDLDGMIYEANGKKTRVEVGQNLAGQTPPAAPTPDAAKPSPDGQPAPADGPPKGRRSRKPGPPNGASVNTEAPGSPPPGDQPAEQQPGDH